MKARPAPANRPPLTTDQLEHIKASDLVRLKLTADEKMRLREINEQRNIERIERSRRIHEEQLKLLSELQSVGIEIENVSDLVNTSKKYEPALPILLRHLLMPYSDATKETIARALAVSSPYIVESWPIFVEQYRVAKSGLGPRGPGDTKEYRLGAKAGLACVLSVAVTDDTLPELISIAKDPSHGESRLLLLSALKRRRRKNHMAQQAINDLSQDPELSQEIASWK